LASTSSRGSDEKDVGLPKPMPKPELPGPEPEQTDALEAQAAPALSEATAGVSEALAACESSEAFVVCEASQAFAACEASEAFAACETLAVSEASEAFEASAAEPNAHALEEPVAFNKDALLPELLMPEAEPEPPSRRMDRARSVDYTASMMDEGEAATSDAQFGRPQPAQGRGHPQAFMRTMSLQAKPHGIEKPRMPNLIAASNSSVPSSPSVDLIAGQPPARPLHRQLASPRPQSPGSPGGPRRSINNRPANANAYGIEPANRGIHTPPANSPAPVPFDPYGIEGSPRQPRKTETPGNDSLEAQKKS
jgi:hypothetical protein